MHVPGLLLAAALAAAGLDAGQHLLAGAQAFREGRFDAALVEFRVAAGLGAPEAGPYAAASLVKLSRPEEALEAFGAGEQTGRDALLDYYRAMACYEARLYLCADRLLAGLGDRSGPRIAEQASRVRAAIARELAGEPATGGIDWYHARCQTALDTGRGALAAAYCREAADLADRRKDRYRRAEAIARLGRMAGPGGAAGAR